MKIAELYRMLCRLYGVDDAPDIEHFLILAPQPSPAILVGHADVSREALLLRQTDDALEVGLFIDPAIIASIENGDILDRLDDLACAAEGASHFLYIVNRAEKERRVSMLELELQGEVDKFLLIHLIASERSRAVPPELFAHQFERHTYSARLSPDEVERYATASHFAAKYCAALRTTCFNPLRLSELTAQARGFFEQDLSGKLSRLIP